MTHKIFILCIFISSFLVFSDTCQNGFLSAFAVGFSYISIFFHEIGHAIFGLIFGYPSLPSFDFEYGGGMTYHGEKLLPLQIVIYIAAIYGLYFLKTEHDASNIIIIPSSIIMIILFIISFNSWHEAIILFMGHGTEAIIGAFLLTRAYFNIWLTRPYERWLNAIIGGFIQLNLIKTSWMLMYDNAFKNDYFAQKGQHSFGDLSRITNEFTNSSDIYYIALFLFIYVIIITLIFMFGIFFIHRNYLK